MLKIDIIERFNVLRRLCGQAFWGHVEVSLWTKADIRGRRCDKRIINEDLFLDNVLHLLS